MDNILHLLLLFPIFSGITIIIINILRYCWCKWLKWFDSPGNMPCQFVCFYEWLHIVSAVSIDDAEMDVFKKWMKHGHCKGVGTVWLVVMPDVDNSIGHLGWVFVSK